MIGLVGMSTIFSNYDIRGRLEDSMSREFVWNVGKALAEWLPQDGTVAVVSADGASDVIIKSLIEGLRLQGRHVIDGGVGDQQTLSQINIGSKTAGGVLLSHDTLQNVEVIALYQENDSLITMDTGLQQIIELAESGNFVPAAIKGELTSAI